MSLPPLQSHQYQVEFFTEHYAVSGILEPFGMLSTYLDLTDRSNLQVKQVTATALDNDSAVNAFQSSELWMRRDEILALRILGEDVPGLVQNLPVHEKLRIFIPRFVVQGVVLRGTDTKISDLFEAMKGAWASVAEARVYPLAALRTPVFREAALLLINKRHIRFYEAVKEPAPTPAPAPETPAA